MMHKDELMSFPFFKSMTLPGMRNYFAQSEC